MMKRLFNMLKRHALSIALMVVLVGIAVLGLSSNRQAVYNCTLAEFHPDFPIKAREECRRIRREANK
jgi:hypothetical protein